MKSPLHKMLLIAMFITLPLIGSADDADIEHKEIAGMFKVLAWDSAKKQGIAKFRKKVIAFEVNETETTVRKDLVVKFSQSAALRKKGVRRLHIFGRRTTFTAEGTQSKTFSMKPRLILAAGFSVAPTPYGKAFLRKFGEMEWLAVDVMTWKGSGQVQSGGETCNLEAHKNEKILYAVKSDLSQIKKGKTYHLSGVSSSEITVTRGNKFIPEGKKMKPNQVKKIPFVTLDRVIVLNKSFMGVYAYMFEDSYPKKN